MMHTVQYQIQGKGQTEVAHSIEEGVREGRLLPGAALPTVRELAARLGLSPTTVAAAYRSLQSRGVLSSRGRRGTRVAFRPPVAPAPLDVEPAGSPRRARERLRDVAAGNPDQALLPDIASAIARIETRPRLYGEDTDRPGLLALASGILEADGISARNLAIVGGAMDGVERVLQAHLRPGDRVAAEDPGYAGVLDLLPALGLLVEPMRLDDHGPVPEEMDRALQAGARAVVVTPRAQNPTGAALDETRARALRAVLDRHPDALLVEDDHAGPVAGVPAVTLASRRRGPWAVVRSVSKSLGPDLRLAFLAGDPTTIARVVGRRRLGAGWVSHVLQEIVESMLASKGTERLLAEATRRYSERREALVRELQAQGLPARGRSGMNVWVEVPEELRAVQGLAERGWAVRGGERYRIESPPAVRITTATLSAAEARRIARDLRESLADSARSRTA